MIVGTSSSRTRGSIERSLSSNAIENFRMKLMWRCTRLKLLLACFLIAMLPCESIAGEPTSPKITFSYNDSEAALTVVVANDLSVPLAVYDSFRRREVPGFLRVRVEKDGKVVSGNTSLPEGFVSSTIFESTVLSPPVQLLTMLPHEEIATVVKLDRILRGTQQLLAVDLKKLGGHCLVFEMTVFVDQSLTNSVTERSLPMCLPGS